MTDEKKVSFDIDGSEAVSKVLLELLNTFPGLGEKKIRFSTLSDSSGIGFFPTSGAAIQSQKEDITGHVKQECLYPFRVVYRAAPKREEQKLKIKELLDSLGKWLEQLPAAELPPLSAGNRVILSIARTTPAHLETAYTDGVEDWSISATLHYKNEFDK